MYVSIIFDIEQIDLSIIYLVNEMLFDLTFVVINLNDNLLAKF